MDENKPEEVPEVQNTEPIEEIIESEEVVEEVEQPVEVKKTENKVPENLTKKLVEQPKQIGAPVPGRLDRLKTFIIECKRVLRVTKEPDKQEFLTIVKISAVGMAVIGVIGFIVHFIKEILF